MTFRCENTCRFLSSPAAVLGMVVVVSLIALGTALTAEVAYGLEPCVFCIYQRIPFIVAIALGLTGLIYRKRGKIARGFIFLSGLTFLTNAGIAFFHSGIERKWWRSPFESCAADFGTVTDDPGSLLENILSAPTAPCETIAWADPVLGLSMANYNVLLCAGLFAVCIAAMLMQCPKGSSSP